VQANSDDEKDEEMDPANPNSLTAQAQALVSVLNGKIVALESVLQADLPSGVRVQGSVTDQPFVPLGQQRLRSVELVLKMVQLKKETINDALVASKVFANIIELVKAFPWNNFLQLKVINIVNEVLENNEHPKFRELFLVSSGLGKALVEMSEKANFQMESERNIRNGFMALVISVSNKLQKKYRGEEQEDNVVSDYLDGVGEEWRAFVDDELKKSNENNNKTLGGCTTRNNMSEEDEKEDSNYDVQMEKIMARFTNFNQILSQTAGNDDDDDDDDEDTQEDKDDNFDEDDKDGKAADDTSDQAVHVTPVVLKKAEDLQVDYTDNNYWKVESDEVDVDSLLAELDE